LDGKGVYGRPSPLFGKGGSEKADEEGVWPVRPTVEFGMELNTDKEAFFAEFDGLDDVSVG